MFHGSLSLGLLAVLAVVYLDTHAREPLARAVGAGWSPSPVSRGRMNAFAAGCSIGLTGVLMMAATGQGRLLSEIAAFAAALSLFHAAIHAATYHLLLRRLQSGGRAPARTIDQFLDPRRLSYFDLAAYWAAVFALLARA
jgi:hypothetical protein